MIRISKWLAGAAATLAILLGSTDAEAQRGRPDGDGPGRPDPSEMFQRMDENKDGELSKEEVRAFFARHGGRPGGDGDRPGPGRDAAGRDAERRGPEGRGPDSRRPDGPPPRGDFGHRGPEGHRPGGPPQMDHGRAPGKGGDAHRSPDRGDSKSGRGFHKSGKGRRKLAGRNRGGKHFGPPVRGGRPAFSHRGPGPGGPPWMQHGRNGGPPFGHRPGFGHHPSFGHRGPGRASMGPPWMRNRGPEHRGEHRGPEHRGKHGRRDGDHDARPEHRPRPEDRGGRPERDRRPEGEDRPERRETSLTAEAEAVVETESVVETATEITAVETAVEVENAQPAIIVADELPEIVPGLAQPESPALPEDDSAETDAEEVVAESALGTVETVVTSPVETLTTPQ